MSSMWRKRRKSVGQALAGRQESHHSDEEGDHGYVNAFGNDDDTDAEMTLPTTDSSVSSSYMRDEGSRTVSGYISRLWSGTSSMPWSRGDGTSSHLYEEQRAKHYGYAGEDGARINGSHTGAGGKPILLPRGRTSDHARRRDTRRRRWYGSRLFRFVMVVILSLLGLAYYLLGIFFIPQFTLKFDKRAWVDSNFSHLTPPPPLHAAQCFELGRIERETMYNWTEAQVLPRRRMVNAGTGLNVDMGCYEAAKLVQPIDPVVGYAYPTSGWIPINHAGDNEMRRRQAKDLLSKDLGFDDRHIPPQHRVLTYHTYWRTDLLPFSDRQASTLRAFLATQPLSTSRVVIWSNSAATLAKAAPLASLIAKFPTNIQIRQVEFTSLTRETALEGNAIFDEHRAGLYDGKGWIDGDAVRLLVLYQFGGVWMDMDQVLTRDLRPLMEHEFVSQWDCEDKPYLRFNGALMHFRRHSPYLCEAFHIMSSLPPPRPNSLNWGAHLYHHLYRRLLHGGQTPFAVLPWCFTDPQNCRKDIAIPSPFTADPQVWRGRPWTDGAREELEGRIGSVFSVHLHNQWTKSIPDHGWLDRLVRAQEEQVRVLELYQRWDEGK